MSKYSTSPSRSFTFSMLPRRKAFRWGMGLLLTIGLLVICHSPLLRWLGTILVVEDPLQPSAAIVVMGGQVPFRAMEAAQLYKFGWAPKLVLVRATRREEQRALQALGITAPEEWTLSLEALIRLGVPPSAILIPDEEADSTLQELRIVDAALKPEGKPVILVTSKYHARRVRLTWNYVVKGRSQPIVRPSRQDPFDPQGWWKDRRFILAVVREYLGLINYYAGFKLAAQTLAR